MFHHLREVGVVKLGLLWHVLHENVRKDRVLANSPNKDSIGKDLSYNPSKRLMEGPGYQMGRMVIMQPLAQFQP